MEVETGYNTVSIWLLFDVAGSVLTGEGPAIFKRDVTALLNQIEACKKKSEYEEAHYIRLEILQLLETASNEEFVSTVEILVNDLVLFNNIRQARIALPSYAGLSAAAERRLGPLHPLTLKSKENLANVYAYQGQYAEAAALMADILPGLIQQFGTGESAVELYLTNLEIWYRNSGQEAEAVAARNRRWAMLPVCPHIKPLEDYIIRSGIPIRERGRWGGVIISVDAYLDTEALKQKLSLAPCVEFSELDDPHYGFAQGLECSIHHDRVWGWHPREKKMGSTLS